jgi:hypothetical protein
VRLTIVVERQETDNGAESRQRELNSPYSTCSTKTALNAPIAEYHAESWVVLMATPPARAVIEEQDRLIAEKSGTPPPTVKSIRRSGAKRADEVVRSLRSASAPN